MNFQLEQLTDTLYHAHFANLKDLGSITGETQPNKEDIGRYYSSRKQMLEDIEDHQLLERLNSIQGKVRLIVSCSTDFFTTLEHELAHHLYATDSVYKRKVNRVLRGINYSKIIGYLEIELGYEDPDQDEVQARLIADFDEMSKLGIVDKSYYWANVSLRQIFNDHTKQNHIRRSLINKTAV